VRNQLHALVQLPVVIPAVRARMEELIATFDAQIAAIERDIDDVLCGHAGSPSRHDITMMLWRHPAG